MSELNNTNLFERAAELIDQNLSTYREKALVKAIDENDLDELRRLVTQYEAEDSERHFHENDII